MRFTRLSGRHRARKRGQGTEKKSIAKTSNLQLSQGHVLQLSEYWEQYAKLNSPLISNPDLEDIAVRGIPNPTLVHLQSKIAVEKHQC